MSEDFGWFASIDLPEKSAIALKAYYDKKKYITQKIKNNNGSWCIRWKK
jgi:hypothetical protein